MKFRSLMRYALMLIWGWMVWPTLTYSAEISCWDFWSSGAVENVQRSFPSGRRPVPGTSCVFGILRGTIVKADDEKLVRFYRAHHPFLKHFILVSPGGNVEAAINIGRLFRKYLITAEAPKDRKLTEVDENYKVVDRCLNIGQECICASACALIWFGAVERRGEVGLHRPTIEDPTFRALSPAEASATYRRILGRP